MVQYRSIYRKWRPQFFEDIIGQEHITRTLKNAIKLNRIAHAYLFSGPRGVGKTTTARILAKALNCQLGPTEHPCNRCSQCIRINNGQSMDVVEIDGASNRGIDEIRELKSKISLAPVEGKYKVYIIDEVHMLTNEAFNALLKTLEEPPDKVLFIFATTAPQKVPKTISSRCQCFDFHRISLGDIIAKLKKICEEEKLMVEESALRLIAENAAGSLRDAESILDQLVTYSEDKITDQNVQDMLGIAPQRLLFDFLKAVVDRNTKRAIEFIDQLVKQGKDLHQFVEDLIVYTHHLSLVKIFGIDRYPSTSFNKENIDLEKVFEMTERVNLDMLLEMVEELNQIEDKIKYHHYPWILLELFVVKATYIQTNTQGHGIKQKVEERIEIDQGVESFNKDDQGRINENNENIPENTDAHKEEFPLNELWPKTLLRIKNERISLYAFLTASNSIRIEDNQLIVRFHKDCLFHKESLEKRENRERLEAILKEEMNSKIQLKCFMDDQDPMDSERLDLAKVDLIKDQIKGEKVVEHVKSTKQNKEENSSLSKILEEARDLFGGNIRED
ncbi:MAG: DNA polymerase III subunit gamma/tau [Candidatus Atribacteria bacterium]|nr:DNA polymerase III subunit gamma/tau [Candidatus Atribacteria bacterium]